MEINTTPVLDKKLRNTKKKCCNIYTECLVIDYRGKGKTTD
jgi:hypothetical protein